MQATPGPVIERLDARRATIGEGFEIRRAVPHRHRRLIGAWCFLDHAGPADYAAGRGLSIGPHPHIGLQTFTWMIEGTLLHRDSLGCEQLIHPGQVNLMTAGRGISHSEESQAGPGRLHTAQLWIALPDGERHREPDFRHYPTLPILSRGGFRITVLAGTCDGATAPARVFSPLVGLDLAADGPARTTLPLDPAFEHGAIALAGEPAIERERLAPGTLLYLGTGREAVELETTASARLLLVGGAPFGEEVLLWWNFVARSAAEMEAATRDWEHGTRFGRVAGTRAAPLVAPDVRELRLRAPGR